MWDKTFEKCCDEYCEEHVSKLVQHRIGLIRSDLYNGPLYFDDDGEPCEWCDKGAHQFDFSGACDFVRDHVYTNLPDTLAYLAWWPGLAPYNEDSEADLDDYDVSIVSPETLVEVWVGSEVWNHIAG